MTTPLTRRLERLEQFAEAQRRPIRERVGRIMLRLGARLPAAEVEAIVRCNVGTPARIRQLHAAGLTADQIFDRLMGEAA
jgi:hypothetical protein